MNTALNYQPEVLVDTADLSREDWLDYRRLGIGGSDAAAIMGLSPFSTIRDLYFDKIGVTPVIEEEDICEEEKQDQTVSIHTICNQH